MWGDVSVVDVFDQVEEELRSDRYKRLARTWLPVVGGVLLAALLAALVFWFMDSSKTRQAGAASVAYERGMEALEQGNSAAAQAAFVEAADAGSSAYEALALNQQAGIAVTANRIPEAVTLFDRAAKASKDPILADMAALKAAFLVMDTAPIADLVTRLEPLGGDDRPFRAFAQEALALARLQHGQAAEAREIFVQLSLGQDVPDALRQRSQQAMAAIDNGSAPAMAGIVRAAVALPPQPAGLIQAPGVVPGDPSAPPPQARAQAPQ